jgi:hypothetical protein
VEITEVEVGRGKSMHDQILGACRSIFLCFLPFLAKKSFQSSKFSDARFFQGRRDNAAMVLQYLTMFSNVPLFQRHLRRNPYRKKKRQKKSIFI